MTWKQHDIVDMVINPFNVINLDPELAEPHETIITEELWIEANVRMIEDLGPAAYLERLLRLLRNPPPPLDEVFR